MIKTVEERQRGGYDFSAHYDSLCLLQNSCPLPMVKANLEFNSLDLNADRIRPTDWIPILKTIEINKTLKTIIIRSSYRETLSDPDNQSYRVKRKPPAIRSKEITNRLCKSIKECLQNTPTLSSIFLYGVPLRERDINSLTKGILNNKTVTEISLENCCLGDNGLEIILKGIRNSSKIFSINFSGCNLTPNSANLIADLIKHQAMKRHNEAWQDSLRYRRPDLDKMTGVRRITLNNNVLIEDNGANYIANALRDDLWVKAVDLQNCGITDNGAKAFLEVLRFNTALIVLDVRRNPIIESEILDRISEQILINSDGRQCEFKWIDIQQTPKSDISFRSSSSSSKRKTKLKQLNSSIQKTSIRVSSTNSTPRRRSISAGNAKLGVPWRTAARATRYKGYPPDTSKSGDDIFSMINDDVEASESSLSYSNKQIHQQQIEVESLKKQLNVEKEARKDAERLILELRIEIEKLKADNDELKDQCIDNDMLDNIGTTFDQFHNFIDLLNKNGLGKIVEMAGLENFSATQHISSLN